MATLPTPGGDAGTWGTELNEYLAVSLDTAGKVKDGAAQTTSAAPGADAELANKKYVDDHVGHDGDGYVLRDIDGTPTKVYAKYFTGTLDADSTTSVAHSVTASQILSVTAIVYDSDSSAYKVMEMFDVAVANKQFKVQYDDTNITMYDVGAHLQGQVYRVKIDYYT